MQESKFYKIANRHFEEIKKHVDLWLDNVEESLLFKNNRQKIWDAMRGKESERRLINLLPKENSKKNFQDIMKNYLKGKFKEKTLSRIEMKHLLVRKMLELTNPNSEYDVLLFQKVKEEKCKKGYFLGNFTVSSKQSKKA